MGFCYNDGCLNGAEQRCSNCKIATYCSPACQREAWSTHKRECEMNRILREHQEKEEAKPVEKPPTTHCTGCNVKYDRDEYAAEDLCADCGYTACESCVSHHSRGSCYCLESNFGRRYCNMSESTYCDYNPVYETASAAPQWYHMSSRTGKSYVGDRHPDDPWILEENPDAFEAQEKICGNCGEKKRCLKKEYC